jgi:ABC-2 type transport system ATP-binding protein
MKEHAVIETELTKLKALVHKDPMAFYSRLLNFTRKYALDKALLTDVILFGSRLNELVEKNASLIPEENKRRFVKESYRLLEALLLPGAVSLLLEQSHKEIEGIWDRKKPQQSVVFKATDLGKKLSSSFELKNVSFDLKLGEITGLVGENGNGKTSLLKIISGELASDRGTLGYPIFSRQGLDWKEIKRSTGYVKQILPYWTGSQTVRQQLEFTAAIKGITAKEIPVACDLMVTRLGLEKHQRKKWFELSSGYKLRFELARQLIWKPKLLILDEPLANLDLKSQMIFLADLRSLANSVSHSMSVIISSQNIFDVEKIADRIIFLKEGTPLYNGYSHNIPSPNGSRCFEVDTTADMQELLKALSSLDIYEIKDQMFSKLIYTKKLTDAGDVLKVLIDNQISVRYFRDISNSTRLLFEND